VGSPATRGGKTLAFRRRLQFDFGKRIQRVKDRRFSAGRHAVFWFLLHSCHRTPRPLESLNPQAIGFSQWWLICVEIFKVSVYIYQHEIYPSIHPARASKGNKKLFSDNPNRTQKGGQDHLTPEAFHGLDGHPFDGRPPLASRQGEYGLSHNQDTRASCRKDRRFDLCLA
jgi:hypothetical protein